MGKIRPTLKKDEWRIEDKHTFYTVYHYALSYSDWKLKANQLLGVKGVSYDGMPHGSDAKNPTEATAIKYGDLIAKIRIVEDAAKESGDDLCEWVLLGVTNEGMSADMLIARGMPCSNKVYYRMRRKFYYLLSKKLDLF